MILDVDSNTSVLGEGASSGTTKSGFRVRKGENVIFQNLKLGPASAKGDIIALDESTKIWIDHNDFKSLGLVGGKDDLDGKHVYSSTDLPTDRSRPVGRYPCFRRGDHLLEHFQGPLEGQS